MSAVAAPSQQPASSSLNTPGFFSSAFLELNVFDQCFSSLAGDSTTSDQEVNPNDNMPSPKSSALGRQNEYTTSFGPGLSLPSPTLHERRYTIQHPQSPLLSSTTYAEFRRQSMPEHQDLNSASLPSADRRFSHQHPLNSSFPVSPGPPWTGSAGGGGTTFREGARNSYYIHPTPPNSTHSSSPVDTFNSEVPPLVNSTPVESLSPLDTLITDNTAEVHGQVTPPTENMALFDGSGSGNDSSLPAPPEPSKNTRTKRGSAKSGSSNSRKSKKAGGESSSAEQEVDVHDAKRKRFLERNRVAASKCRQKKKQWMQELENNARKAQSDSKQLHGMVSILREELLRLKGELLKHSTCGCDQISTYLLNEATKVAEGAHRSMTIHQTPNHASNSRVRYSVCSENSETYDDDDDDMLELEKEDAELSDPPGGGGDA